LKIAEFQNDTGTNHLIPGIPETKTMKFVFKPSSIILVKKVMILFFCFLGLKELKKHTWALQSSVKPAVLLFRLKK
jgi:hypothetical protein